MTKLKLGGGGGLEKEWGTKTFVNPPYSKISGWVKKDLRKVKKERQS